MPRYIDAENLKAYVNSNSVHWLNEWDTLGLLASIYKMPTEDVQKVNHAHWSCVNEDECNYMCDGKDGCGRVLSLVLGSPEDYDIGYCPFCGAKMDEVKADDR